MVEKRIHSTLKHYVEFFLKDRPLNRPVIEVASRDYTKIEIPNDIEGCTVHAFQFFDRQEAIGEDGEVLRGERRNHSSYYKYGIEITLQEASEILRDKEKNKELGEFQDAEDILHRLYDANSTWKSNRVLVTKTHGKKTYLPLQKDDIVLPRV